MTVRKLHHPLPARQAWDSLGLPLLLGRVDSQEPQALPLLAKQVVPEPQVPLPVLELPQVELPQVEPQVLQEPLEPLQRVPVPQV